MHIDWQVGDRVVVTVPPGKTPTPKGSTMHPKTTLAIAAALAAIVTPTADAASCSHTKLTLRRITVQRDNFVDTKWNLRTDYATVYTSFRILDDKGATVIAEPTQQQEVTPAVDGVEFFDQLPDGTPKGRTYRAAFRVSDGHGCTTDATIRFRTR